MFSSAVQGTKNFAMVAIDKSIGSLPRVVGAGVFDLRRKGVSVDRLDVSVLVMALQEDTPLFSWMQVPGEYELLPRVERVIVHVEQISLKNKFGKKLGPDLGKALQRQSPDLNRCVVKMSQPHIHRGKGPMFHLGSRIIEACSLKESTTYSGRKRQLAGASGATKVKRARVVESDVEPDSEEEEEVEIAVEEEVVEEFLGEYRRKKKMSSDIFRYVMGADAVQQAEMQLDVDAELQEEWKERMLTGSLTKYDDVGDALLHGLNEILCGSSNYRPLMPATPCLHVNRSVVVSVFPDQTYYVVLNATWNLFTVESVGIFDTGIAPGIPFKSQATIESMVRSMDDDFLQALNRPEKCNIHRAVEIIKVIVKQVGQDDSMKRAAAGALTNSAVSALAAVLDVAAGDQSRLMVDNTKKHGWSYTRTTESGLKFQVVRSGGKHTNAVLSCINWFKINAPLFLRNRLLRVNGMQKMAFFQSLAFLEPDEDGRRQLGMVRVSEHAAGQMSRIMMDEMRRKLGDLILIGLSKNGQYISAIAENYKKKTKQQPVVSTGSVEQQEPVASTSRDC